MIKNLKKGLKNKKQAWASQQPPVDSPVDALKLQADHRELKDDYRELKATHYELQAAYRELQERANQMSDQLSRQVMNSAPLWPTARGRPRPPTPRRRTGRSRPSACPTPSRTR